ncbi:MAG: hypothetical protein HQL15_04930, partial [Candidatus Omnitrophica bacterium]|nr:hypothetical protein [Candidatus Omnitrophota bacterium]
TAYVVEARLKVMLEEDYVALNKNNKGRTSPKGISTKKDVHTLGSQIIHEIIIPELTREVNQGKNFAQLRQVYNSLILATWYKKKIKDSILAQVYADKNKVTGVDYRRDATHGVSNIYEQYLQAFKKGVYNYIKEESDVVTQKRIPRKYFSGGFGVKDFALKVLETTDHIDFAMSTHLRGFIVNASVVTATTSDYTLLPVRVIAKETNPSVVLIGPAMAFAAFGDSAMTAQVNELLWMDGVKNGINGDVNYQEGLQEMYRISKNRTGYQKFFTDRGLQDNPFLTFLKEKGFPEDIEDFLKMVNQEMKKKRSDQTEFQYGAAVWIMWFIKADADYDAEIMTNKKKPQIRSLWNLIIGQKRISRSNLRRYICDSFSILMVVMAEGMGFESGVLTRIPILVGDDGKQYSDGLNPTEEAHVAVLFNPPGRGAEILDQGGIHVGHKAFKVLDSNLQWKVVRSLADVGNRRGETAAEIKEYYQIWLDNVTAQDDVVNLGKNWESITFDKVKEELNRLEGLAQQHEHSPVMARYEELLKMQDHLRGIIREVRGIVEKNRKTDEGNILNQFNDFQYQEFIFRRVNSDLDVALFKIESSVNSNEGQLKLRRDVSSNTVTIVNIDLFDRNKRGGGLLRAVLDKLYQIMPKGSHLNFQGVINSTTLEGWVEGIAAQRAHHSRFFEQESGRELIRIDGLIQQWNSQAPERSFFVKNPFILHSLYSLLRAYMTWSIQHPTDGLRSLEDITAEKGFGKALLGAKFKDLHINIANNGDINITSQIDKAMGSDKTGGIDFSSNTMRLQTRNGKGEIKFHLDSDQLARFQDALGFTPVIINIQPMMDLKLFLGLPNE